MKVFVTGATGFVGQEILARLNSNGHAIRFLARNPASESSQTLIEQFGAEAVRGDVRDAASLRHCLKDIDAIIHLVGIISECGTSTFENIHTSGTRNLITAAQDAGVDRFVHMSALGTRPNAISRYHTSKWAAEESLRNSRLQYTIFRPSIIYGKHDHFVNLFSKIARISPVIPIVGSGNAKLQPIAVSQVATAFAQSIDKPESIGKTFDLCGPEELTFGQLIDEILKVTRRRRLKVSVPLPFARLQASALEFFYPRLLGKAPPLNRQQILMLQEDNIGDPRPSDALFELYHKNFAAAIGHWLN